MPERFWNASTENRAVKDEEENLRANFKHLLNWDSNIRPQGPEFDDDADIPPLETEDDEVLSAVTAAALVVDPAKRAPARNILEITRERWAVIMEQNAQELDQLRFVHGSSKM